MSKPQSSSEEIECKFLNVDKTKLEKTLAELGAEKKFSRLFKRNVFDFPDLRLHKESSWLRVRDEGDKVTMSYKQRQGVEEGGQDKGMTEIEVVVEDFEKTADILKSIGMITKFYEENRRTLYMLDGAQVTIDEWPLIPQYVEIEADSWQIVEDTASKLGFDLKDKKVNSTMQVYKDYGIDEMSFSILTFNKQEKAKR